MRKQAGQVVLILILVMTVALSIGISVVQRSLSDISTSTRVEESQRAFSAAEAGIEKTLANPDGGLTSVSFSDNQSQAEVTSGYLLPAVPTTVTRQVPLEYPPLSKEQTAHVWLADYNSPANPPAKRYSLSDLDIFWGSSTQDKAAIEVTLIYHDGALYQSEKWFLDWDTAVRNPVNNFDPVTCSGYIPQFSTKTYQCKKTLTGLPNWAGLMMITVRLLYTTTSQPIAIQATGTCGWYCSLPPQARVIVSVGSAGKTQRKIQLFQTNKVAPPYFDYGLFALGEINK